MVPAGGIFAGFQEVIKEIAHPLISTGKQAA